MDIERLINAGEGEEIEFKKSVSDTEKIAETICAMANRNGGYILIGVSDSGDIIGIMGKDPTKTIADIAMLLSPPVAFSVFKHRIGDKDIIVVEVPSVGLKPISYKGKYLIRIGSTNRPMPTQLICDMYWRSTSISWDSLQADISKEDLDMGILREVANRVKTNFPPETLETDIWASLKLVDRNTGKFTNSTLAIAGKKIILQWQPRFQVIISKKTPYGETPIETIAGNIPYLTEQTMKLLRTLLIEDITRNTAKHTEIWKIPSEALREGIINALIHRDYTIPAPVKITLTDSGLTIHSPGNIPAPMTAEDLNMGHTHPVPRNPIIATTMSLLGYVEKLGSGVPKILSLYSIYETKPHWSERSGFTFLHLPYIQYNEETTVLVLLKQYGCLSTSEIASYMDISKRSALYILRKLRDKHLTYLSGSGRYAKWCLSDKSS